LEPFRSYRLVALFLVFGVLAPSGCVVWFMNVAVRSQTDAARQSVNEAYRSNLRLLRDRADSFWRDRAAAIEAASRGAEQAAFQRIVTKGLADSVILPHYPSIGSSGVSLPPSVAEATERSGKFAEAASLYGEFAEKERDVSLAAQDARAQIRCLLRAGDRTGARNGIAKYFERGRLMRAKDSSGRLIAADEMLLAVHLGRPRNGIETLLNDYSGTAMPSAQRLFLMDELRTAFPTSEAERIALEFREVDQPGSGDAVLERTRMAGIWRLPVPGGRITALYRTASVQKATQDFLGASSTLRNVSFVVTPPGARSGEEAMPAGAEMPGWTLAFELRDPALIENTVHARTASYIWIGCLMIACLAITGVIVAQWFRRLVRLASLKTDLVAAVSHELRTPLSSIRLLVENLLDDAELEPAKTREYLKLIDGENLRLAKLIENFLTFSRL
jgi:signal transduction histidine kinase